MLLNQNLYNDNEVYITPSEIIEFMYCPRFIYFMKCLGIRQFEEKRYKVIKGRKIHKNKSTQDYVRTKIGGIKKNENVYLISKKLGLKGIVDEVYKLKDRSLAPVDFKYAEYKEKEFLTYKTQMALYSLIMEEQFKSKVNKMFLVYVRSKNLIKEIDFDEKIKKEIKKTLDDYKKVVEGYYPKATKYKTRCIDCCYKNICDR